MKHRIDPIGVAREAYIISRIEQAALVAGNASAELQQRVLTYAGLAVAAWEAAEVKASTWEATVRTDLQAGSEAAAEVDWNSTTVLLAGGQAAAPYPVEELKDLALVRVIGVTELRQLLAGTARAELLTRCDTYLAARRAYRAACAAKTAFAQQHLTDDLPPALAAYLAGLDARRAAKAAATV